MSGDITAPPKAGYVPKPTPVDVIVTTSTGDLSWLTQWKSQLSGARILVAHDASVKVTAPAGFEGIQCVPGPNSGALGPRDLAVLASKSPRVLFLSDGASPASNPKGEVVQILSEHGYNLDTPATPVFFNTLYDPFRPGTDFVRGYPFSWRDGVKTAVSHGLTLGQPDLDAATQVRHTTHTHTHTRAHAHTHTHTHTDTLLRLLKTLTLCLTVLVLCLCPQLAKPQARNTRYVDATLTVPKEALVSLSARNMAFDRCASLATQHTAAQPLHTGNRLSQPAANPKLLGLPAPLSVGYMNVSVTSVRGVCVCVCVCVCVTVCLICVCVCVCVCRTQASHWYRYVRGSGCGWEAPGSGCRQHMGKLLYQGTHTSVSLSFSLSLSFARARAFTYTRAPR